MSNKDLRERSGSVNIRSRLTSFLYDLMRDHLTPGVVEELVQESIAIEVSYTNGYLAQYAFDMAKRLEPYPFSQGGVIKDVLRTYFMRVKDGRIPPLVAAEKVYAAITENDPLLTGKDRHKNETVDPPKVKEFEKGYLKQSIREAEDERVIQAITEAVNPQPPTPDPNWTLMVGNRPEGLYGVFCEPIGHKGNPRFIASDPKPYEDAVKEADFMNHSNHAWHYYAKPLR